MTRIDDEREGLRGLSPAQMEARLLERSGLPGPRGNLELLAAAVDVATPEQLAAWASLDAAIAPTGTTMEYLPVVGTAGLGRLVLEGADRVERDRLVSQLAEHARDPRWRVREGVAMALQRVGSVDMPSVLDVTRTWAASTDRLLQRAVVAGLCEPALLRDSAVAEAVVQTLDRITATLPGAADRRSEPFRVLRQALGYGWSVAAVAAPAAGRAAMERWFAGTDPDVRWVMRENLKKTRLARMDADWVARWVQQLGG